MSCAPPSIFFFYLPSEHPSKSAKDSVPFPDSEFAPAVHNNQRNVSHLRITGSAQLAAMWRMASSAVKERCLLKQETAFNLFCAVHHASVFLLILRSLPKVIR